VSWRTEGIELPLPSGFAVSRSLSNSAQEVVNYRLAVHQNGASSAASLYQTEGIDQVIASLTDAPCRGSHTMNGKPYFVIGTTLYRIDLTVNPDLSETWAAVSLGTIAGDSRVVMDSIWSGTGYEMAIVVPSAFAYSYTESSGVVQTLSGVTNFLSPVDDVVAINGFLVFLQTGTNVAFHSNLNDVSTYNALDFELITRIPKCVGLLRFRGQLYIMGEHETLPYSFIGGANFVFVYQPNSTLPCGIVNQYCKVSTGSAFFYLGGEDNEAPAVWISSGGAPQKVSDETIEYRIRGNSLIDQSYMFTFSIDGGKFVALQIGHDCFVYDLNSGKWHRRESLSNSAYIPWRVNSLCKAYGRLLVGDSIDGRIGELSNSDTEYGQPVNRYFITRPFDNRGRFIQVASLMLIMDVGFGGTMVLSWSDDGVTWSDGIAMSAGSAGEFGRAVKWDRLGTVPYSRALRIGTSSGVKANINRILAL
jgi:hypothetical protein